MPRQIKPLGIYNPTPNYRIKGMLRQIFLRSRERSYALKRDQYKCCECGIKQCMKKGHVVRLDVHHVDGITAWEEIFRLMREQVLCHPDKLQSLCRPCHLKKEGKKQRSSLGLA